MPHLALELHQFANLVVTEANAANLSPNLTTGDVVVTCTPAACADNTAPTDVEVSISGYSITIGGVMPFVTEKVRKSAVLPAKMRSPRVAAV